MADSFRNSLQHLGDDEVQQNQVILGEQVEDSELLDEIEELQDELAESENLQGQVGITPDLANKQLTYVDLEGNSFKASDFLDVVNVIKNLDTQRMMIVLHHVSACFDRELTIYMGDLKKTRLFATLTSNGVVVYEFAVPAIAQFLMEKVDYYVSQKLVLYQHMNLGWSDATDMSKGFFASSSIGAPYYSILNDNEEGIIGPKGDRELYEKMILGEVIPNKTLHLPFVLAFTAPIVPLLYEKSAVPVLMTNFTGVAGHGKTTSQALLASVWGKGEAANGKRSLFKTFLSTQNGYVASVNDNNGVPILFDDYETAPEGTNFSSLIYTLASGESKIRCDKYGHTLDTYQWRTSIILSGESSIFDRIPTQKGGLRPRVIEFKNITWTSSAKNSTNITSVVANNYGFYGEEFVRGLIGLSKEDLDARYDSSESVISSMLTAKDNTAERIQNRLVLIRMTAQLVRDLLDLDIDVDYITEFLVSNELKRQNGPSDSELAKEAIAEYVNVCLSRFVRTDKRLDGTTLPVTNMAGRIYQDNDSYVVIILPEVFNKIMSKFNDRDAILDMWEAEKFLLATRTQKESRYEKKARLTSITPSKWCYWLIFTDKKGKLYKRLSKQEEVSIQALEDERRLKDIFHKEPEKSDNVASKANNVPQKAEMPAEITIRGPRVGDNQLLKMPLKSQTSNEVKISETQYDDAQAIEEIFNKEGE